MLQFPLPYFRRADEVFVERAEVVAGGGGEDSLDLAVDQAPRLADLRFVEVENASYFNAVLRRRRKDGREMVDYART